MGKLDLGEEGEGGGREGMNNSTEATDEVKDPQAQEAEATMIKIKSPFDYMKKREANIRRNEARLVGLGFNTNRCISGSVPKDSINQDEYGHDDDENENNEKKVTTTRTRKQRGMLFATKYNGLHEDDSTSTEECKRLLTIEEQFPHRTI